MAACMKRKLKAVIIRPIQRQEQFKDLHCKEDQVLRTVLYFSGEISCKSLFHAFSSKS